MFILGSVHLTEGAEEVIKLDPGVVVEGGADGPYEGEEEVADKHVGALLDDLLVVHAHLLLLRRLVLIHLLRKYILIIILLFTNFSVKQEHIHDNNDDEESDDENKHIQVFAVNIKNL